MNSHLVTAMTVYEGILLDAQHTWPQSVKHFGKDHSYLLNACQTRGLPFFTVLLPSMCKLLDRGLSQGCFPLSSIPQGYPKIKKRPELFGELYLKVFDEDGTLKSDPDINAILFLRQLFTVMKKYHIDCPEDVVIDSVKEFMEVDAALPPTPLNWDSDTPVWTEKFGHPLWGVRKEKERDLFEDSVPSHDVFPWDDFRLLCRRVISSLGTPSWWDLVPKHGPGAVSESRCWKSKFDFPYWPRKLGTWFPFDWFGSGLLESTYVPDDREPASRLIAVPKTYSGPRLICAEPMANQWIQQCIRRWLEDGIQQCVLGRSIDFRSQECSRTLALSSSLTRSHCTIDLSSASDRLSCRLVEYVFQGSEILDGLHACRTRLVSQDISKASERFLKLRKFSTQGSALTFPVQTIVFTILSVFALRVAEGRSNNWDDWEEDFARVRVFGDDIIIPNHVYETMTKLLASCGLKVNTDKSFSEGNFRESCGMDAFKGVNVTPVRLIESYTGAPETTLSLIETANNFHVNGFWYAARSVAGLIPKEELKILPVVGRHSGNLGLRSFVGDFLGHLKSRWNKTLHRAEYSVLAFTSKVNKVHGRDTARLSQFFFREDDGTESCQLHLKPAWSSGQVGRVRVRKARTWVAL